MHTAGIVSIRLSRELFPAFPHQKSGNTEIMFQFRCLIFGLHGRSTWMSKNYSLKHGTYPWVFPRVVGAYQLVCLWNCGCFICVLVNFSNVHNKVYFGYNTIQIFLGLVFETEFFFTKKLFFDFVNFVSFIVKIIKFFG